MSRAAKLVAACLAAATMSLASGCAPKIRPAIYLAPNYASLPIEEITVLPAVDARIDTSIEVDISSQLRDSAVKALQDRGYRAYASDRTGDVAEITDNDLTVSDPAWVKSLGPTDARWILVVVLADVHTRITFGSTGNAEVIGYLYDRNQGALLWRDRGVGRAGQGSLAGLLMAGAMDELAISDAMQNLMQSVPVRDPKGRIPS